MVKDEIIVDKTTVWKTVVELKRDSLTKGKYIDLSKMKNLKVHNISKLVKDLRTELQFSQRQCSKILGVGCFANYENSNQAMPFATLLKMSKLVNFDIYKYVETNNNKFSFGTANEIPLEVPISPIDAVKLSRMFRPSKLKVRNILYVLDKNSIFLEHFEIHLNKDKKEFIYSSLLWTYLNTYFNYIKRPLLNFPLTNTYLKLRSQGVSNNAIIFSLLLTEGSKNSKGFDFSNKSDELHNLLVEAIKNRYNILPTTYNRYVGDVNRTFFSTRQSLKIRDDIEKYLGNIQTKPGKNIKTFLENNPPTLDFVKTLEDKIAVIRIFAVTEGGVYFLLTPYNRRNDESIAVPCIHIACSHPKLLLDLYDMVVELGFRPSLRQDKTWSGWAGIRFNSFVDSIRFLNLGGFLENVKVARSDSYFYNLNKQEIFLSILELRRRMLNSPKLRKMRKGRLIREIIRISRNKEYVNKERYINMLRNIHIKKKLKSSKIKCLERDVKLLLDNPGKFFKTRS